MFRRPVPKPKLKVSGQVRLKKKRNDYVPGFVYIFHDAKAIRGEGITMCKIGLSRTPKQRRYFLSNEYNSNLELRAIVPTFNMRLTEILMHNIFAGSHQLRSQGLNGYTEWFNFTWLRVKLMQIALYTIAIIINFCYLIVVTFLLMFLSYIVFKR
jgi:hypothetical protein